MRLTILHLYPKEMNLYGDHGNILTLKKRCQWRGIEVKIINHEPGQNLPARPDIIFGGGGQDSGQASIAPDLKAIGPELKKLIEQGTPTLVICGLYQLFGNYFLTTSGNMLDGASIFDIETIAGPKRLIGNIVLDSPKFGSVAGYENHSGLTKLNKTMKPLGTVTKGAGNNGEDKTEGVFYKNAIGTYLHGPILPKNPRIADFLIATALERNHPSSSCAQSQDLPKLDDRLENKAHKNAVLRPR